MNWFHPSRLVIEALTPLEGGRRCFRLVGGVLVERTVSEVVPAVTKNRNGVFIYPVLIGNFPLFAASRNNCANDDPNG